MTGYLLDSHVFLWLIDGSRPVARNVREAISGDAPLYLSTAGIAELCLKNSLGKLPLPEAVERDPGPALQLILAENRIEPLAVTLPHAAALRDLPLHHREPFDRLMIAQAMVDGLTLVTHDRTFARYHGLRVLWA